MSQTPNYSDPAYWESLGIAPIVINPDDQESIDAGFEEVKQRIEEAINAIEEENKADF